jgi:hypothetical protein
MATLAPATAEVVPLRPVSRDFPAADLRWLASHGWTPAEIRAMAPERDTEFRLALADAVEALGSP